MKKYTRVLIALSITVLVASIAFIVRDHLSPQASTSQNSYPSVVVLDHADSPQENILVTLTPAAGLTSTSQPMFTEFTREDGRASFASLPLNSYVIRLFSDSEEELYINHIATVASITELQNGYEVRLPTGSITSPTASPSPSTVPTPEPDRIQTLRFTPETITRGQTTKLEWAAHPVTFVEFNNSLGRKTSSGSLFLTPDVTTTYTATVTYSIGTETKTESKSVTITVNQPSETVSAPPKPTNLTVTNDGTNVLSLSWRNSGSATTGYHIYRSTSANVASAEYIGQADRTSYTDTLSISDRSTYYYWVRSYKQGTTAIGVSEPSTSATITLNARLNTPTLTAKAATGTKIKLTWNRFTKNNVSENDSWELWRKADGESDFTKHNEAYSPTTTRWTDTLRMKRNTRYYYKIRAYKTIRGERLYSDFSNEASAKS